MTAGFFSRIAARLQRWFPERQIYHRSNGHVQFVVLSMRFQVVSVLIGLSVMSWIAYASVMTAFKNQIVAAQEERVRDMQGRYESQIARMRMDYDDLATKMAVAEERFTTTVAAIEKRQGDLQTAMAEQTTAGDALDEINRRAGTVRALGLGPDAAPIDSEEDPNAAGGTLKSEAPAAVAPVTPAAPAPAAAPLDAPEDTPLPVAKPATLGATEAQPSSSDNAGALQEHADAAAVGASEFIASGRNVVTGKSLASLSGRLDTIVHGQQAAAADIFKAVLGKEDELRSIIEIAGMNPDAIAPRDTSGQGGPFIPDGPDAARIDPMKRDPNLDAADATLDRVDLLRTAMLAIPMANPIPNVTRISSRFGGRSDPFTGGHAFHAGLDFKGPFATDIKVTAPGKVISAGWHGGYGQMVEVDHGYGLKTRYAHMSKIVVVEGQMLAFGDKVGELGSTGRSTGPHLHYEIWHDGQATDPWKYLKAGANVLQRQQDS